MHQRTTSPDAIEPAFEIEGIECQHQCFLPGNLARGGDHFLRRVDRDYLIAHFQERKGITPRATSGVKYAASDGQLTKEWVIQNADVNGRSVLAELGGMSVVVSSR